MNVYIYINKQKIWLIRSLIKKEIAGRYKGTFGGKWLAFFGPVVLLVVETIVFGSILKAKWTGGEEGKLMYALILFSGLMPFNLFAECLVRAPNLIVGNSNYVTKMVFPVWVLPIVVVAGATYNFFIALIVWMIGYLVIIGLPTINFLWLLIYLPIVLFYTLGLCLLVSSLGVYVRDLNVIIGVIVTGLLFASPVFYKIDVVPEQYRFIMELNPLSFVIEYMRGSLIWHKNPDPSLLIINILLSILTMAFGAWFFKKVKKGFSDVL